MTPLATIGTGLALLVGLSLPARAVQIARTSPDASIAGETAAAVVDVEIAGFLMTE